MKEKIKRKPFRTVAVLIVWLLFFSGERDNGSLKGFADAFAHGYQHLPLPDMTYDYKDYFTTIPQIENLNMQEGFFKKEKNELGKFKREKLKFAECVVYDHLDYEIDFNLQRIALEKEWVAEGRQIPKGGLYELKNHKKWYSYFIKKFTGLSMTPEEVMVLGEGEVQRVKDEIKKIQIESGYADSTAFYTYLASDVFYITDKQKLVEAYEKTDSTVRSNLPAFIGEVSIPPVYPMEWADAGPATPPGMYVNRDYNPYGKDIFKYNFYGGRFNRRAVEWLYMHEAIPGHHLQASLRSASRKDSLQALFSYPGNFEGWACYIEYEGKELGAYRDLYSYLGKWEWDLVRSARLVIDAGIHYYGWTREQALEYWRENIPGQDDIADREVTRVTNWTAQALSYKAGADCIMQLKEEMQKKYGRSFDEKKFHRCYLSFGMRPLEVIKKDFEAMYSG